ncbi:ThiF family adenylyltransferase [Vibrio coralliirubri]|uniref:ThiF family adenylyltransferase n=1 Tax=Vibrio coralliirubri TaxID=1516159 RepID=UPI002FCF0CE2
MTEIQSKVEEELLARGFSYAPIQDGYPIIPAFRRSFNTNIGEFIVLIPLEDTTLLKLPRPRLIEIPEQLSGVRLPHLEGNQTICLFDEATRNIDPLNPKSLIAACVVQLESIIQGWVEGSNYKDIAVEFASYWEPERSCFLLSDKSDSKLYSFNRTALNGDVVTEYSIAQNMNQATDWSNKRNRSDGDSLPKELCNVINIKVNRSFFIPLKHKWPLENLGEVFTWLGKVDSRACSSLLDRLRNEAKQLSTFMIVMSADTIHVGLKLKLGPMGKAALGINLTKRKKLNYQLVFSALSKKHRITSFQKFRVDNSTEEYVFSRNSPTVSSLKNKKVCIIGCGTIGGYLTQGLVQMGAGTGKGQLYLFDSDTLKTGNLGRHLLGLPYLGERKSDALSHFLSSQSLVNDISACGAFNEKSIRGGWDLIVDATGEQSFSLLLASWYRKFISEQDNRNMMLIHSWISGFGHQAKSLLDDGSSACFACMFNYSTSQRNERYPSFAANKAPDLSGVFKRTCGESHLPFGPEASMTAASLTLRLLKQEPSRKYNYLQKSLSELPIQYPEKSAKPVGSCPVCQS